ncbi:MAG: glycosyltransferase family 4 protein [Phycisphaerales bacterium]
MATPATFLIISQVYIPDPASVGQHIADAAAEMARRGYRVIVYASARGYDDPTKKYPSRETLSGVEVRRLPLSSLGKSSIAIRLIAQWIFLAQATLRGLFTRNLVGLIVSTSPPFCGVGGALISLLRRVPMKYWAMDLNPDQMIAMRKITEKSLSARVFNLFNRVTLRRATEVIALDRFMVERLNAKLPHGALASKMHVMPPWPHEDELARIAHDDNPFRKEHKLDGKFVVMYSGNHSPANPIATILDAAERLQDDDRFVFMCIGGGGGKKEVEERVAQGIKNIRSLPYQPLNQIKYSLSAADVHIVSIGDSVVGIVHPCKVYGAMAVSRPILLLGPNPCHVSDLIDQHKIGWHISHGNVDAALTVLREMAALPPADLKAMGERAAKVIATTLSKASLQKRFCDVLQRGLIGPG